MFYQIILRSVFWNKDICFYNVEKFPDKLCLEYSIFPKMQIYA